MQSCLFVVLSKLLVSNFVFIVWYHSFFPINSFCLQLHSFSPNKAKFLPVYLRYLGPSPTRVSFEFLAPLFKNGNTKREHHRDNCEKDSDLLTIQYRTHRYLNQEKDHKIKCWETSEHAARINDSVGHGCLQFSWLPLRGKRLIALFCYLYIHD